MMLLVVPARSDPERDLVSEAFRQQGGKVLALDRFWDTPNVEPARVRLYGPDTFCQVVAHNLRLRLIAPDDSVLARLDERYLRRAIRCLPLHQALQEEFPSFVKPVMPKLFQGRVYSSAPELADTTQGLEPATPVLMAEPVQFHSEVRSFILDGIPVTSSMYEGEGDSSEAESFLAELAGLPVWPRTVVLDVGRTDRGWALIEANATWGAGLNGCDPQAVARCLLYATETL